MQSHNAVEFPHPHDHQDGGSGPHGGVHGGAEAQQPDTTHGSGTVRARRKAGIQGCVFELVTANRTSTVEVGEEMCSNRTVRKISFMGSTPVGKLSMKLSSDTVKRLSLELGGNAAFIGEPPNAIDLHMVNL